MLKPEEGKQYLDGGDNVRRHDTDKHEFDQVHDHFSDED